jgi:O-antigen ligase
MLVLQDQLIRITRTLRRHSLLKTLSAIFLFAVCIGGDIFFINSVFILFYAYFTFLSLIFFIFLKRTQTFKVSYAVIPLIVFIGICFLSLFWSVRLKDAEIVFVSLFTGFLTYILFSNIVNEENDTYLFLKFIVSATSLNALLGIFQGTIGGNLFTLFGTAAQGTTYHPNYFSGFLGMVYPIAILVLIKENRNVWLLPIFFILLANHFSTSRGGSLTIILLSAASLCFLFFKGYPRTGIKILFIIILSVLVYLFAIFLIDKSYTSTAKLALNSISSTSVSRLEIWQGTLQIILHHPFWGVGLRSFEDQFKYLNNPFLFSRFTYHSNAHNLFLHLASEIGIVGLLFFFSFSCWVLYSCLRNYENTENPRLKLVSFFLLLAILGFFFHNLGEYKWEHPLFQVLFYFLVSSFFAIKSLMNPDRKEICFYLTRPYKIGLSGLLVLFWIFYVGSPLLGNYYLSRARHYYARGDGRALTYLLKASLFDSSHPEPYWLLSQTFKNVWLNTNNPAFLEKAIDAQKKTISLFPMNADFYLDLAKLLGEAKRLDEAKLYYEKATSLNPNTLKYKEELASFLERNNETDKAIVLWEGMRTFLERYEPKGMNLMKVYAHLGAVYKKMGSPTLVKKYLNLVMNFPDDAIKNEPYDSPIRKSFNDFKKIAKEELGILAGIENPKFKKD